MKKKRRGNISAAQLTEMSSGEGVDGGGGCCEQVVAPGKEKANRPHTLAV